MTSRDVAHAQLHLLEPFVPAILQIGQQAMRLDDWEGFTRSVKILQQCLPTSGAAEGASGLLDSLENGLTRACAAVLQDLEYSSYTGREFEIRRACNRSDLELQKIRRGLRCLSNVMQNTDDGGLFRVRGRVVETLEAAAAAWESIGAASKALNATEDALAISTGLVQNQRLQDRAVRLRGQLRHKS